MTRDDVIRGLECRHRNPLGEDCENCHYGVRFARRWGCDFGKLCGDALALLKALDVTPEELERLKLCRHECKVDCLLEAFNKVVEERDALLKAQESATVEPKRLELADETKAWLDKMDAVGALSNIAAICIDWDGYRTVDGLGGLVNEIWAYARYCADRLNKAQEPVAPVLQSGGNYVCGNCGMYTVGFMHPLTGESVQTWKYCGSCGKKVRWE